MGIIDSVTSTVTGAYKSAKAAYNNKKGLFGTNYRTGVLNDFSIVTKAVFHILRYDSTKSEQCKFVEALPVQINPDHLNHAVARQPYVQGFVSGKQDNKHSNDISYADSIDIRLIFDIYDDYVAGGEILGKNISLFNDDYTSLPKLIKLNTDNNYAAGYKTLFKWGEVKYFGVMSGISVEYTAFSRWGSPLKAEVTVSMSLEPEENKLSGASTEIEAYTKVSDVLNKVTLAGLTGAKEIGGIALGVVQSLRG